MDKSHRLLNQALALARQSQNREIQVNCLIYLGWISNNSLAYHQQALALTKGWKPIPQLVDLLVAISTDYRMKSDYPPTLQWLFKALKTAQDLHQPDQEASILRRISDIYSRLSD